MSSNTDFDVELFEQRLSNLKDTQEGIQQMSSWCLQQRTHHKKIVSSWLNVLKQVRVEHRLTLFYLANDVIQYSKRKNYEFVESWGTTLQKATTMVRDEKVRNKIFRIFKIWEQREIYSEEYLSDLNGLLSMNPLKKSQQSNNNEFSDDFQNGVLVANIKECVRLAAHTDKNFKNLPKAPNCDTESVKNALKDRRNSDEVENEFDQYVRSLEAYVRSLKAEMASRKSLLVNIEHADTFYRNQRGEVKVVVNAYKNFGNRIKVMKKKLDEITPNLPSPIPSPDINAPSPEQDADIVLPDEQNNLTTFLKNTPNGYTSYMDGKLPFDINDFKRQSPDISYESTTHSSTQPIEVISNRKEEKLSNFDTTDFFKSLTSDASFSTADIPQPVPPVSNYQLSQSTSNIFSSSVTSYGSHTDSYNTLDAAYTTNSSFIPTTPTNTYDRNVPLMPPPPIPPSLGAPEDDFNSTWDMDMSWTSIDSSTSFNHMLDTPVSPPHFEREGMNSGLVEYIERRNDNMLEPIQDVDHRQLHLPPTDTMVQPMGKDKGRSMDIDHRNLISLTGSPGPKTETSNKRPVSPLWSSDDKDFRPSTLSSVSPAVEDIDYRIPTIQEISSQNLESSSSSPTTLLKPPPLPPQICEFLSSPNPTFDKSMPPPSFAKPDASTAKGKKGPSPIKNSGKPGLKGNNANDNNESIDMEMSDEDIEEYVRDDLSQPSESADSNLSGYDSSVSQEFPTSPEPMFRQPLLKTPPDFPHWECHHNHSHRCMAANNGGNEMIWKSPRGGNLLPQFRISGPQFAPRCPGQYVVALPQRNFPPQIKNFRLIRVRGSPYFNNRGRMMRGQMHRGNFRGKQWQ